MPVDLNGRDQSAGFEMHALSVLDGILALSAIPGRDGAYALDLEHIAGWKPSLVITLVTEAELVMHKAADLGLDLQNRGARWLHLPISDFGTPDAAFVEAWPAASANARQALQGGGRVLVHCRGGCGRSGMIALRLMIEAGDAPEEALERLRTRRPCAIETEAQMAWAMAARRQPAVFLRHGD